MKSSIPSDMHSSLGEVQLYLLISIRETVPPIGRYIMLLINKVIDQLLTVGIQHCSHLNTWVENTSIDKTTEGSILSGTLLHTLPRNPVKTLPLIFLCHLLNSAHLLTSGSFFQHDSSSSPCQWPSAFQIIRPHLLDFMWCPLFYNVFNMFSSCWSSSPVKSQSKAHTEGKYRWTAGHNWVAGVSGCKWSRSLTWESPGKQRVGKGTHLGSVRSGNMKQAKTDKEQDRSLGSDSKMSRHNALM